MHRTVPVPAHPQRIISLVPSQTELLHDLGLGERVVGITKFCIHPEGWFRSKPRVGGTKKVDLEKVRVLKPDLIIGNKEENERADIEALEKEFPVWMSDVDDLDSALEMIRRIGTLTGTMPRAEEIASDIADAFAGLQPLPRPVCTAYLIWRKPYMAVGSGTFIHDMLERCGLINVFADKDRYPVLSDPPGGFPSTTELVLLSSEPFPFKEVHAEELRLLLPGARCLCVDGEPFSWYGSRLLRSASYFAALLARLEQGAP
ncbi:MAG TPA: helical backbone metal receptor [Flavobacteriales bacterium]|nr:helical backbone metal receptor [Flavobacteriales bacterium]